MSVAGIFTEVMGGVLQPFAESLMLDACTVSKIVPGDPVWDGEQYVPPTEVVYSGPCQLPKRDPNAQDADAGETNWAVGLVQIKIPARTAPGVVGDPLAVTDGHLVDVTSRPGLRMTVRHAHPQTFEKSRKVSCEVASRDAG